MPPVSKSKKASALPKLSEKQELLSSEVPEAVIKPCDVSLPTPIGCWADSVPEEYQTPAYGGQMPPEQLFAEALEDAPANEITQSTDVTPRSNMSDSANDVNGYNVEENAGYYDPTIGAAYLPEDYYYANQDMMAPQYYDGSSANGPTDLPFSAPTQMTLPPPPVQVHDDSLHFESLKRWFRSITEWIVEVEQTCDVTLPPPPPPPDMSLPFNRRPYNEAQWEQRISRWHQYVVSEYYNNVLHPENNIISRQHSQPQQQSYDVPQPTYYSQPQPVHHQRHYETHSKVPQPSYAAPQGPQAPSRSYRHQPYATPVMMQNEYYSGPYSSSAYGTAYASSFPEHPPIY